MELVVPWAKLVALIAPHARGARQALGGRPRFAVETMLRIHCLQLWWNLSDPVMEEELQERQQYRQFAGLAGATRLPGYPATRLTMLFVLGNLRMMLHTLLQEAQG